MKDVSEKAPSDPGAQDGHSRRSQPAIHEQTEHVCATLFLKLQACSILYKKEEFIKLSKRCVTTTFPTQPPSHPHTTQED